jgi:hypothetical protein
MKKLSPFFILLLVGIVLCTSCKKDDDNNNTTPTLNIPAAYQSANYNANTTVETSVKSQFSALIDYMKSAQDGTTKLTLAELNNVFASSNTPNLKAITGTYYVSKIESVWFKELVDASGNSYDPKNGSQATTGGAFNGRLFDKGAKENIQEIEKGLYAAALYNHILTLLNGTITEETVDRMVSAFGASPEFPNTDNSAKTNTPDAFLAKYTARRDKNDGKGFYTIIQTNFIKLLAAVKAGSAYEKEKNEAIAALKINIEKAMMATSINYGYGLISKLSKTNPSDADIAGGLHDLGEAIGFLHGFKAIPQQHRIITDAQIDEILVLMNAPHNGNSTAYKFVTEGATELKKITQYQAILKDTYGFTNEQMDDFKQNWVSVQNR